ncbi:MAG: hypothetical protein NVS4B9_42170 [Ktedonobacteraceae bacterium]
MQLDLTLDQLGSLRPTRRLGNHRTPVQGLYISGVGTPGRMAARALLADQKERRRSLA